MYSTCGLLANPDFTQPLAVGRWINDLRDILHDTSATGGYQLNSASGYTPGSVIDDLKARLSLCESTTINKDQLDTILTVLDLHEGTIESRGREIRNLKHLGAQLYDALDALDKRGHTEAVWANAKRAMSNAASAFNPPSNGA